MSFKAAIFDMDGVITNTVPIHFSAWKKMFTEYGKQFTFEDYEKYVDGIPRMDGARAILKDLPEDKLIEASDKKQKYFLELLHKEKIPVYNTTIDLIKNLRKKNIKIAAISSSKNCPYMLKKTKVDRYLDAIVSGNDITKGKPDPQIFLMAAKKINIDPEDCVVFEDAILGVLAAKNAGMKCVGIDRYKKNNKLSKADMVIEDASGVNFEKIKELFKK